MTNRPLSIISLEDFPKFLELEWISLYRNIQLLKSVQSFVNCYFQEFVKTQNPTINDPIFSEEEFKEIQKWFDPKTKYEEVKDNMLDLAIKITKINREETDIPKFIREMSLTYLVSNFENYFAKCLLHYYQLEPRALLHSSKITKNEQDKMISYNDVLKCEKYDEIIGRLIQKELDILMREDIAKIIQYFQKLLKMNIDDAKDFTEFKEIFYRRNSIIHHQGFTNPEYNRKNNLEERVVIHLDTNYKYLENSFNRIIEYAKKIKTLILEKGTNELYTEDNSNAGTIQ